MCACLHVLLVEQNVVAGWDCRIADANPDVCIPSTPSAELYDPLLVHESVAPPGSDFTTAWYCNSRWRRFRERRELFHHFIGRVDPTSLLQDGAFLSTVRFGSDSKGSFAVDAFVKLEQMDTAWERLLQRIGERCATDEGCAGQLCEQRCSDPTILGAPLTQREDEGSLKRATLLEDPAFQKDCPVTDEMLSVPKACYYTGAARELVAQKYADDVSFFGYVPPDVDEEMTGACAPYDF